MKILNYISRKSLLAFIPLSLLSCGDQLEQFPTNAFAKDVFWTSESNAMIALAGMYRGGITYGTNTVPNDWWSYFGSVFLEFATDNAYDRRGDNSTFNKLTDGTLTANNNVIQGYWEGSYKRIAITNDFLENIGKVPTSEAAIRRLTAEARFLRATQYFYMSQHWGSVPLVTKTLTPDEANQVEKAPKSAIVQFVIDELTAAAADLPGCQRERTCQQAGRTGISGPYVFERKAFRRSCCHLQTDHRSGRK
jgi:hypothetical protein